jgi:melibiose permease/lactose/raffinose/galactose permease
MAKMGSALQQVIIMVTYIAIGMTTITNSISEVEKQASLGDITEAQKASMIEKVLNSAPGNTALWLRVSMVVAPIVLIGAAYLVMRAKVKIDENKYKEMLTEILTRREDPGAEE